MRTDTPVYADTDTGVVASTPANEMPGGDVSVDADVPDEAGAQNDFAEAERMDMDESVTHPGELEEVDTPGIDLPPLEVMAASYAQ